MSAIRTPTVGVQPRWGSAAQRQEPVGGSEGFALVLALLALLLLTFLGLTLATTTSTELQIASNYRWSQQAAYNAEAGIEVAKVTLRNTTPTWASVLPVARGGSWPPAPALPTYPPTVPLTDLYGNPLRHLENGICDTRGGGTGYGLVLNDPVLGPLQYINTPFAGGPLLNGAFTVWVRRNTTLSAAAGTTADDASNVTLVLTSEGIAPFFSGMTADAQANMAVAVQQIALGRAGGECDSYSAQSGGGVSGSGFDPCARHNDMGMGAESSFGSTARQAGGAASSGFGSGAAGSGLATGAR